ncbi:hypothetical protein CPC16_008761 [Podila verticillata]|nr:hypothetical protein BGZ59_007297 [Podila verticillata]KAF9383795.1 hypothetical protein CPC16_008761 [Podila verticillata]KFH69820.1 hypothetical protein MVEG_04624 [Podila verticillata NRRL 6337]
MLSVTFVAFSLAALAMTIAHALSEPCACKITVTKETFKSTVIARLSRHGHRRHHGGDERDIVPDPNVIQGEGLIRVGPRLLRYPNKLTIIKEDAILDEEDMN